MDIAVWIGSLVDVVIFVWILILFREIQISTKESKEYLRRIALSLPINAEQMKLVKRSLSTEEAMALFEQCGGGFKIVNDARRVVFTVLVSPHDAKESKGANSIEPELLRLLSERRSEVQRILLERKKKAQS